MQRLDALILLRGVREVASIADAESPVQVSQRHWDAARQRSERFAGLPQAKDIARRLRLPWGHVLQLAHAPAETHAHRLGRAQTQPEQDWLTDDFIGYVLRFVSRRLDVSTITPGEYRAERERMLSVNRTRWLHGRRQHLPTDEQIRLAAGSWDHALALARLERRPGRGDQGNAKRAPMTVELLERCYAVYATEPSALELRRFARGNHIPWTPDRDRTWLESVAAWKDDRRARGLDVPAGPPARHERPDYSCWPDPLSSVRPL
jgi:hypothetical protein